MMDIFYAVALISNNVEIYRTAALSHFLLTSVLLLPMRFIVRSRVGK